MRGSSGRFAPPATRCLPLASWVQQVPHLQADTLVWPGLDLTLREQGRFTGWPRMADNRLRSAAQGASALLEDGASITESCGMLRALSLKRSTPCFAGPPQLTTNFAQIVASNTWLHLLKGVIQLDLRLLRTMELPPNAV